MRKKFWKWIVLIALLVLGVFAFWIVGRVQLQERVRENGQALIELVNGLEDGERITTDDVPFEWDRFVVYEPYTRRDTHSACMGNSWFDDFIMETYLCFFHDDKLTARVTNQPNNPKVFQLMWNGELIGGAEPLSSYLLEIFPFDDFIIDNELIGMWDIFDSLPVMLMFDSNGMGTEFNNSSEIVFAWTIEGNVLVMKRLRSGALEISRFYYKVTADILILTNIENDMENEFYRVE